MQIDGIERDIETLAPDTVLSCLEHHIDHVRIIRHLFARVEVTPESVLVRAEIDRLFEELAEGPPQPPPICRG